MKRNCIFLLNKVELMRRGYIKLRGEKNCYYCYILMRQLWGIRVRIAIEIYCWFASAVLCCYFSWVTGVKWNKWNYVTQPIEQIFHQLVAPKDVEKIIVPIADSVLLRNFNRGRIWIGFFVRCSLELMYRVHCCRLTFSDSYVSGYSEAGNALNVLHVCRAAGAG